ncbi:Sin-like protein conserved region-domain-containing protein [Podospora appendiculata]|uniref:Sin-like protein conserved region-domain-containing protein n=1 Tax=Podospora appendiculata TaxID=314037 RepID=A0AAE0X812_9PEZI|nr:Sin-like protein conserved region-domain-containing protein [Podospora appendiculata]
MDPDLDDPPRRADGEASQKPSQHQQRQKDDDEDPIVATYSVFIKPPLEKHRKVVVLQYVNKTSQDPAHLRVPRVTAMRVKPGTGMYEVDVPVDTTEAYDRNKGVAWGTALQKSMETKRGGSLGLAGGFGVGAPVNRGGRRGGGGRGGGNGDGDDDAAAGQLSWVEANRQEKVFKTQTLGGGESAEEVNTRAMVGVFQGKNIHLTPVYSLVHLRPVAHHLDAVSEQERLARATPGGPPTGAADKSAGRAIHMTLKAAMDDEGGLTAETMADRLRAVQAEAWQKMEYVHDEDEAAWEAYNECLLLRAAPEPSHSNKKGKEPATAAAAADGTDDSSAPDLVTRVAHLQTDWGEDELLRAVAGIKRDDKKPGEEAILTPHSEPAFAKAAAKPKPKAKAKEITFKEEVAEADAAPNRRPGRATAAAARRGGSRMRGGGGGPSDAMDID